MINEGPDVNRDSQLERSGESGGKGREGTKDSVEFVLLLRCLQDNQVEMDI